MTMTLTHITSWLIQFGDFAIFPLVMIEGPIITVIAGSLCALGILNLFFTYFVIVIADLTTDCLYYSAGRYGGKRFIDRYGHFFGINLSQVTKLKNHFDTKGGQTLFLGKVSHGIGGVFLVAAGLTKMPFKRFLWYNFLATLVKSIALLLIGYFFGTAIMQINSFFKFFAAISICLLMVAVVFYFNFRIRVKND